MSATLAATLRARLETQRAAGLYRQRLPLDGMAGIEPVQDGRRLLSFCSNDYLGLAGDRRVIEALQAAAGQLGVGSTGSHLVSGHRREHEALEAELAAWLGRERALLFSSGYHANLGVLTTLAGRTSRIYADRLNHASLLDGARLSGGRLRRYPHRDLETLRAWLDADSGGQDPYPLVVTDGVFSMDGVVAPLAGLAGLARTTAATLIVDDAHGIGVIGPGGRGAVAAAGLGAAEVPVLIGTLGKALGTAGAFVAGSETLIEALVQFARSHAYTTAPPPALAAAARTAVRIAWREDWRREHLARLSQRLREGLEALGLPLAAPPGDPATPIIPLLAGTPERATRLGQALLERGLLVMPIRPPTVPAGTARLRITLSAAHEEAHIDRLLEALGDVAAP